MKTKIIISCFLLILFLGGCNVKAEYDFLYSVDEISAIEIVQVDEESQEGFQQTMLAEIEDIETFLLEFNKLDCYSNYTDPIGIENGDIVIKVIYSNGDYEMIGCTGQARCEDGTFDNYVGRRYFEQEEYNNLIDSYTE